jgi:phenylpyruvate tautomerase PptA (4-oxalocrotonate tautomerase family)
VEDYFSLIRNLPDEDKIELIAKISNSIVEKIKLKKEEASKEEILAETYGCFESSKTADEIIEEIYNSRHFTGKNPDL